MTTPNNQDQILGPEHFAGWPATVSTERLERAIQYVRDRARSDPDMQELPTSGDTTLDMDMSLIAQSMISHQLITQVNLAQLDLVSDAQFVEVLREILQEQETEHHFASAIITHIKIHQSQPMETITIKHIFTLAKHPDWMGLSPILPNLQDHHVHTWESHRNPHSPRAMIAIPDIMMPKQVPESPPIPQGGIQVLAEVAAWHGVASFHWFPANHRP